MLDQGGRAVLRKIRNYHTFTGEVQSKSSTNTHQVQLRYAAQPCKGELNYERLRCSCEDHYWNTVKGPSMEILCPHLAALELAIAHDNTSRRSAKDNLTGLAPKERAAPLALPFRFSSAHAMEVLVDYFLNDIRQYDLDKELLNQPSIYSKALLRTMNSHTYQSGFGVLAQKEQEKRKTRAHQLHYGAVKALETRINQQLTTHGFLFRGFGVEFKNTSYETIARRYGKRDVVYALCIDDTLLPTVIKKHLGERPPDWITAADQRDDHPYARLGQPYESIDDATRRASVDTMLVPSHNLDLFVPKHLVAAYTRAIRQASG